MSLFDEDIEEDFDDVVEKPEAAVSTLKPPREATDCLGHTDFEAQFLAQFNEKRLPHALILAGPLGTGKATLAFRLARFLLKQEDSSAGGGMFGEALPQAKPTTLDVAQDDPVFRMVASGGHADLLTIERPFDEKAGKFKDVVPVEEVRRVAPFLRMTATRDGGWRVVIVDDADTMNGSSQNAILKILEEPPPRTMIILIVHRVGAMLPTIRSRARTVMVQPPDFEIFSQLLKREDSGISPADLKALYAISGGSVGIAVRQMKEGGLEAAGKLVTILASWPNINWPEIHALADAISRPGQESAMRSFEELYIWIAETFVRTLAGGDKLPPVLDNKAIISLRDQVGLAGWVEICDNLKAHFHTGRVGTLDRRQIILGSFIILGKDREAA